MESSKSIAQQAVENWISSVVATGDHAAFPDLHLDQIHPRYHDPKCWVRGAIDCLELALAIRTSRDLPYTVGVALSLRTAEDRIGVNFQSLPEITAELDDSPPSLYLFDIRGEPWFADPDYEELTILAVPINFRTRVFYREWRDAHDCDYRRAVWILG